MKKKIVIISITIIGTIAIVTPLIYNFIYVIISKEITRTTIISTIITIVCDFVLYITLKIRKPYHRLDQIQEIYMNATEEEKTKIFDYTVQFKHDK